MGVRKVFILCEKKETFSLYEFTFKLCGVEKALFINNMYESEGKYETLNHFYNKKGTKYSNYICGFILS